MARLLLILTAVLAATPLDGQVNIERFRRDIGATGWTAASTVDLSLRTGNVDLVLIGLGARVDHVSAAAQSMLVLNGDVGWQQGERFSNSGLLHLRGVLGTGRGPRPEGFAQVDYDRSRALAFRALFGAGPRAELVRRRALRLSAGTAYMLEYERLDLPATAFHPRRTTQHRWSTYVAASLGATEPLRAAVTAYVQPRLDDFGDTRLLLDGSLGARAGSRASLTVTVALRYDSRPPDGAESLDATLKSGIAIEW